MGRPKVYDKNELLNSVVQLFWQKGLAETSLSDIEKTTGVNKSSLYAEFKDKDEIFVASLTHYIRTSGVDELLSRLPLGRINLVDFLKLGQSCEGRRGCFVVNSVRESAILPAKAISLIQAHLKKVKSLLIQNIEVSKFRGDAESAAEILLTFNAGLCLESNMSKKSPTAKIEDFLLLMNF